MNNLIVILVLTAVFTGCQTNKSGAEISALGESLMSTSTTSAAAVTGNQASTGAAIDATPRTATDMVSATNACLAASRNLCTYAQYTNAYTHSQLIYSTGNPGWYWMVNENIPLQGFRNTFQAATNGMVAVNTTVTNAQKFYCCQ